MFSKPKEQTTVTNAATQPSKDRSSRDMLASQSYFPPIKGKDTGLGNPYRLLHAALSSK